MPSKDIKYIGRDFDSFKSNLIDFAKNYFPTTYNDFSSASPGTMFIEMAAYVGDVLSYYTDYALKESMLHTATERKNIYSLAQAFGYKPHISVPSVGTIDVFQILPSTYQHSGQLADSGDNSKPDFRYAIILEEGMVVTSDGGIKFRTTSAVNFAASSSSDPTEVTVYQTNATSGQPELYLLKKSTKIVQGESKTATMVNNGIKKNAKFTLPSNTITEIVSATDGDGNDWYEVPYLAQDTIFSENVNSEIFDPVLSPDKIATPYILSLKKTARRFVARVTDNNRLQVQFGAGISTNSDAEILPNPTNVGTNIAGSTNKMDMAFDPSNFMFTKTYGKAPDANVTFTYTEGKGIQGNLASGLITNIESKNVTYLSDEYDSTIMTNTVLPSIICNNPEPTTGGKSQETVNEVRQNALAHFSTQQRAVTREDYIIRAYAMPAKYGSIEKAFITQDTQVDIKTEETVANPLALNMYVLGYDGGKSLQNLNNATKQNLKTYLSQYRMFTDSVNIKNGYIINIGVDFEIVVLPGKNSREVILQCINALKQHFHIDRMHFSQPIIVKDITLLIAGIPGVQSVIKVDLRNKWRESLGYSGNKYNLEDANKQGIIYPSLDPSVFEVKFPDKDIVGRAVTY